MSKNSKWFVVAQEGATTDGRNIDRIWIQQMAANYDPKKFGARVNLEHYRGIDPKGLFKAYGDVLAAKAEERDGKLCLLAQIDPTPDLIELSKARQKVYSSIEINPNFADTGEAYLVGLAVTDDPASLGTEYLQFAAGQGDKSPLAARKQHKDNLFTVAQETGIKFEAATDDQSTTLLNSIAEKLGAIVEKFTAPPPAIQSQPISKPAEVVGGEAGKHFSDFMTQTVESFKALQGQLVAKADFTALQEKHEALKNDFAALKVQLEKESPNSYHQRPPATGGAGQVLTDC